jgi:hypothetical protein
LPKTREDVDDKSDPLRGAILSFPSCARCDRPTGGAMRRPSHGRPLP